MKQETFDWDMPSLASPEEKMLDADIDWYPNWLDKSEADALLSLLINTLDWRQDTIEIFGKRHQIPRLQAWYGDIDAHYRYSNLDLRPTPWTHELRQVKALCEQATGAMFNAVLANLYRNGRDSMGFHADDEPELGQRPIIASLSLGATRHFDFQHKRTGQRARFPLEHGSLLVMKGNTQDNWLHGIRKSKRVDGLRINLTFRRIFNEHNKR